MRSSCAKSQKNMGCRGISRAWTRQRAARWSSSMTSAPRVVPQHKRLRRQMRPECTSLAPSVSSIERCAPPNCSTVASGVPWTASSNCPICALNKMDLTPLRTLLKQEYSHEVCVKILGETSRLYREDLPNRWFFLLQHQIFAAITDNP